MNFKRVAGATLLLSLGLGVALAGNLPAPVQAGNGAPSGAHYNLNIIGVDKAHQNVNPDSYKGHVIFVPLGPLNGKCDIGLTAGDYQVTDKSCLDGDRAEFSLPNPDNGDGTLAYSVWVRALGKPGGSATMVTCFTEFADTNTAETTWCNSGDLVVSLNRLVGANGPKFVDVSKQLLQVCADVDNTDGVDLELVPLFSDEGENYFWHYDNNGLRLLQMRFYPVSTTDIGGDCTRVEHTAH